VISNYNYGDYVCDAVTSIQCKKYDNVEVIVVDDGSTDSSVDRLSALDLDNLIVLQQSNKGQSAALNLGVSKARGDYIFFLDSDDLFAPEKLLVYQDVLAECGSGFSLMFDDFCVIGSRRRWNASLRTSGKHPWSVVDTRSDLESNGGRPKYFPPTSTLMIPRAAVFRVFPLDDRIRISADGPIVTRAALIGNFIHIHRTLTKYRIHKSNNRGLWATSVPQLQKCINDFVAIEQDIKNFAHKLGIEWAFDYHQCCTYIDLNAKKELLHNGRLNPSTRAAMLRLSFTRQLIYRMFNILPPMLACKLFSIAYECVGKVKHVKCK